MFGQPLSFAENGGIKAGRSVTMAREAMHLPYYDEGKDIRNFIREIEQARGLTAGQLFNDFFAPVLG